MYLQLEQLSVQYRGAQPGTSGKLAVDQVSLGLPPGGIGVLVGPSGCGKTSLLRAVAGLEPLHAGRVVLDKEVISDAGRGLHVQPEHRRIGMVFQDYALFPHLSVAENIAFGLNALGRGERAARVAEMLALVGLERSRAPRAAPALGWPAAAHSPGACAGAAPAAAAAR